MSMKIFTVALIDINYTDRGYMTCGEKQGMQYHRYLNKEAGYKRGRNSSIFRDFHASGNGLNAWSFCWLFIEPLVACPFLIVLTWPYQGKKQHHSIQE